MIAAVQTGVRRVAAFIQRQKHNYRVAIVRSSANMFLSSLTQQYSSIYTTALGADSVELGAISSIGGAISTLIATPVGWLVDRYGIKRFYLLAIALMAAGTLVYAVASTWQLIALATVLFSIAMRLSGTGCSVICADSVKNEDRATAQNTCVTLASLSSIVAPLVAARLVTAFGGMTAQGIRPLYYIRFAGYGLVFLFIAAQLREPGRERLGRARGPSGFVKDFGQLFRRELPLRRWLLVSALTGVPMAMTVPFFQLYAHQVKGADEYLLGAMTTAAIVARLFFGIPLGRLADRIGRKRVVYLLTPLWYLSNLLLVFAPNSATLVLAGALQTFYAISSGLVGAMTVELVSVKEMGRWSGLLALFRGLVTVPLPILGGLVWRELGPAYVFIIPIAVDVLLRLPLFSTMPETLEP